jgi:hypothetical protein
MKSAKKNQIVGRDLCELEVWKHAGNSSVFRPPRTQLTAQVA